MVRDAARLDRHVAASQALLEIVTYYYRPRDFAVRFWNGDVWNAETETPRFTIVLRHPGALRAMFWPFDKLGLGESYIYDDFDIEGDIFGMISLIRYFVRISGEVGLFDKLRPLPSLLKLPRQRNPRDPGWARTRSHVGHGLDADRQAIQFHYDRPGEFYRLFLGPTMQYTCGYFSSPDEDLDTAQRRKMDYICRKLRLQPGERLLDIGCGWGNLLIHAAQHYGVEGVGVTLSPTQAEWAERAIAEAQLGGRIRLLISDYREIPGQEQFDKATSVGMVEAVGSKNLPTFFRKVHELLKPGGAYLHHSINIRPRTPPPIWTPFVVKYVFSNGELHSLNEALERATDAGFEIRDVENLREHYPLTLEHWVRRLEAAHQEVVRLTSEVNYRIYRLYMAGSRMGFESGVYTLNQSLLVKPADGNAAVPLMRSGWYS